MNPLLRNEQVAEWLGISVKTFMIVRDTGAFPVIYLKKKMPRYDREDIMQWLIKNKNGSIEWPDSFAAEIAEAAGNRIKPLTQLLTVAQAAEQLGVVGRTLYGWIWDGLLPAITLAPTNQLRIDAADLQAFQEQRKSRGKVSV